MAALELPPNARLTRKGLSTTSPPPHEFIALVEFGNFFHLPQACGSNTFTGARGAASELVRNLQLVGNAHLIHTL